MTSLDDHLVADSGGRHVVRPGDTARSIAAGRLGPGSPEADLAAYADRLWRLNSRRVASGRPDVLAPGEVLALPRR